MGPLSFPINIDESSESVLKEERVGRYAVPKYSDHGPLEDEVTSREGLLTGVSQDVLACDYGSATRFNNPILLKMSVDSWSLSTPSLSSLIELKHTSRSFATVLIRLISSHCLRNYMIFPPVSELHNRLHYDCPTGRSTTMESREFGAPSNLPASGYTN